MKIRHVLAVVAAAFVLAACGSESITGPDTQTSADHSARYLGGWAGGDGRSADLPSIPPS